MLGMGGGMSISRASEVFLDLTSYDDLAFYFKNKAGCSASGWTDSSVNGNDMAQSSSGNQAGFVNQSLLFDGTDDHYDLTSAVSIGGSNRFTLFWVGMISDYANPSGFLGDGTQLSGQSTAEITFTSASTITARGRNGVDPQQFVVSSSPFPTRTPMVICITKGALQAISVYKNGTLLTPDDAVSMSLAPFDVDTVGLVPDEESKLYKGYLYELALYERELSSAEIYTVNDYLIKKFGL